MSDVDNLIRAALDASARSVVPDDRPMPALVLDRPADRTGPHWARLAPMLAAAAAVVVAVAVAGSVVSGTHRSTPNPVPVGGSSGAPTTADPTRAMTSQPSAVVPPAVVVPPGQAITVTSPIADGAQVGVGQSLRVQFVRYLPHSVEFDQVVTDASAFDRAATVTVNGRPAAGAWNWYAVAGDGGEVLEAAYRLPQYWPAHATIRLDAPIAGLAAGGGLRFGNSITETMTTGAAHVSTVSNATHTMTVTADGHVVRTMPVSLGAPRTPTERGTTTVLSKGEDISLTGPGYDFAHVKFTVRLTYDGEYTLAAPWNAADIGKRNSSNGTVNLNPADAEWFYNFSVVGDVVSFPDADGSPSNNDWDVPWATWRAGGLLKP